MMNATAFTPQQPVITLRRPDQMLELMLDIYTARGNLPHEIISMTAHLYTLISFLIQENMGALPRRSRSSGDQVQHACDYIAAHYASGITVKEVAAHLGICRSQLYRIFMQTVSMSPQKYLSEFRIRQACNLMNKPHLSIKEVAYSVGFEDPLYFSTVFKASVGQPPSQYAALLKSQAESREHE